MGRKQTHDEAQADGMAGWTDTRPHGERQRVRGQAPRKTGTQTPVARGAAGAEEKRAVWGEASPHLGEAELAAPRGVAGVWGHALGGLIVLGELQGGSRFMTKRPQAAMLRFIWEALRKS